MNNNTHTHKKNTNWESGLPKSFDKTWVLKVLYKGEKTQAHTEIKEGL